MHAGIAPEGPQDPSQLFGWAAAPRALGKEAKVRARAKRRADRRPRRDPTGLNASLVACVLALMNRVLFLFASATAANKKAATGVFVLILARRRRDVARAGLVCLVARNSSRMLTGAHAASKKRLRSRLRLRWMRGERREKKSRAEKTRGGCNKTCDVRV